MSLAAAKDALLLFVSQWLGTTVPRLLAVFAGLLLLALAAQALWEQRRRAVPTALAALVGAALVAVGLDTRVLHYLAALDEEARLRVSVGLLSAMALATAFEAIRRMRLQERYAILWVGAGAVTLLGALFPDTLDVVGVLFGTDYTTSILAVFFIAVALVLFHFSLALSRSDHRESRLAQRCALLEDRLARLERQLGAAGPAAEPASGAESPEAAAAAAPEPGREEPGRPGRRAGSHVVAVAVIVLSGAWSVWTGWRSPEPMVGDEVTHYYMLQKQARQLPAPNFFAEIPTGWSAEPEVRRYPHALGWHYLGAVVYRLTGGSRAAVQLWHALFWAQLLAVGYLLALRRGGDTRRSALLFLFVLASLPAGVMFSVLYYQDVPVAAQVLTAFFLLSRGRRWWALAFLLFALALKETAYLFVPAFVGVWAWAARRAAAEAGTAARGARARAAGSTALACAVIGLNTLGWAALLQKRAESDFYPIASVQRLWRAARAPATGGAASRAPAGAPAGGESAPVTIIANHPGDLRIPRNYVVFGGVLLWMVALVGLSARVGRGRRERPAQRRSSAWLWAVGLSYALPAAWILRSAPDARFFLPAVPFLALPLAEWAASVPRVKTWLALAAVLALMQSGAVQAKVGRLREVSPQLREAIAFLRANPPEPRRVFMYPEGNYRLFPAPHEWYLNYRLREFWRAGEDQRIATLQRFDVGAVVVKKQLIAEVDERITDLGVYPTPFVRDLERDPRFVKVFDNSQVAIYRVPAPR